MKDNERRKKTVGTGTERRIVMFRAWDKLKKVMHHDFQFIKSGNDSNDWILFVSNKQPLRNYDHWRQNPYFQKQLEIMQYTGLEDKNGKKIFEGDFLRDDRGHTFAVRKVPGGFGIPTFCKSPNDGFYECLGDMQNRSWCESSCEVIGNIFKNPELIKGAGGTYWHT